MKQNKDASNKTFTHEFQRLGDKRKGILRETDKPVTPFGGLAVLVEHFRALGLPDVLESLMPFAYTSPNAIGPTNILLAFWLSLAAGARRFAHTNLLRADLALRRLVGWKRWPGDDAVRNFFGRFSQRENDTFFPALTTWLLSKAIAQKQHNEQESAQATLDLDSTVFTRFGKQEGAKKGYNPRYKGRGSHHPLLAVLSEFAFVLHGWLRPGNTNAASNVQAFLQETLALVPTGVTIGLLRADSGFFSGALFDFLETQEMRYIVAAKHTAALTRSLRGITQEQWHFVSGGISTAEISVRPDTWKQARRFVVVREWVREEETKAQPLLFACPNYEYHVFVTNIQEETPLELWREYSGRATIEQRICELKEDLAADSFCREHFYATEAAFRSVLILYNLLNVWQMSVQREHRGYRRPVTLRMEVFLCGAVAGQAGGVFVLHMSQSWGGLSKRKPLIEENLRWLKANAARLETERGPPSNESSSN